MKLLALATLAAATLLGQATTPTQAIQALQGLHSVVEAGVNRIEYSRRVLDAKVLVDRLRAAPPVKKAIDTAMREYLLAGFALEAMGYPQGPEDADASACLDLATSPTGEGYHTLLHCAADQTAKAAKLAKTNCASCIVPVP